MAWSLMLTLPGTPVLLYGDEIGMGEQLALEGRMSVRTPMQWAPGPTGGFSTAEPERLVRPLPGGDFGPDRVNVGVQRREPGSLLAFMTRLIHRRRETPELGLGASTLLENEPPALFAHRCDWQGSTRVRDPQPLRRDGDGGARPRRATSRASTICSSCASTRSRRAKLRVELDAYGYLWLRARRD